jgi:hypothetical protein
MSIRPKKQSAAEAFLTLLNDEMLDRRVAFPAQITAINTDSGDGALLSVDVLPLVRQTLSQENTDDLIYRDLPILANVPVVFPHSTVSGFSLTIPIQIGDQVLIVIADRSIDEWQASGGTGRPVESTTPRAHDLTDAIAVIGISCDVNNVKNYSFDKATLRNGDGTIAVEVSNDDVVMKNGSITTTVGSSDITLTNGSSTIEITSSDINIDADTVTINGIDFSAHIHEIIVPDPGEETTPPIP